MTLPIDIATSLWLSSVPEWEWEPVGPPCADATTATQPGTECTQTSGSDPSVDAGSSAALQTNPGPGTPANAPRPGYHLVFKGFTLEYSLIWFPADSPMSRLWLKNDRHDDDRRDLLAVQPRVPNPPASDTDTPNAK